ncbi:hypothetical protein LR948_18175 [Roseivivax sp. GX 12232]|uniref:hypothetical protein n=1 Tax=Roseivivax sp. GX 12232 TaxID=2900547 RepID=UPI001E5E32BB|nr:hypothetical protein [Roseivivax sp. GX 12232]MCE0507295.1 hypothetical protein [Roseivivax sp. GX 12232]
MKSLVSLPFAGAVATPTNLLAYQNCGAVYSDDVWRGLQAAFSVPVGPQDREGQIYAIVAPWCPFCARMKEDTLAGRIPASVRLIPSEPRDSFDRGRIAYFLEAGADGLDEFFDRSSAAPSTSMSDAAKELLLQTQQATQWNMRRVFEVSGARPGFPMWSAYSEESAWTNGEMVFCFGGWIDDPAAKISENLNIVPSAHPADSGNWRVLEEISRTWRPFNKMVYANSDDVVMRVFPTESSLPSYCYKANTGFVHPGIVTAQGEDWIVMDAGGSPAYTRLSDVWME